MVLLLSVLSLLEAKKNFVYAKTVFPGTLNSVIIPPKLHSNIIKKSHNLKTTYDEQTTTVVCSKNKMVIQIFIC